MESEIFAPDQDQNVSRRDFLKIGGALATYGVIQPVIDIVDSLSAPEKSGKTNLNVFLETNLKKEKMTDFLLPEVEAGEVPQYKRNMILEESQELKDWYETTNFDELLDNYYFPEVVDTIWRIIEKPNYIKSAKILGVDPPQKINNDKKDFFSGLEFLIKTLEAWGLFMIEKKKPVDSVLRIMKKYKNLYQNITSPKYIKSLIK